MISRQFIFEYFSKIIALTEKELKLKFRFKYGVVISFINPIIAIFMPLIVLRKFFEFNARFGSWTEQNFYVFLFMAYNLILLQGIIREFSNQFIREKFWRTLPSLMIAPFNRFNLLFGGILSHGILISIPFSFFLILCYYFYPISILTLISVIFIYFLIALIFSGIGLIIGSFAISNEDVAKILLFLITIIFLLSCITYPYEIFPSFIQMFIDFNPIYYILDFIRLVWIENNILYSIRSYPLHFIILVITAICLPITSVIIFDKIFKKYGIVGY